MTFDRWREAPPELEGKTWHCKCCVEEFQDSAEYSECPLCGRQARLGELDLGDCMLCGVLKTGVSQGWEIEDDKNMTCKNCMETL